MSVPPEDPHSPWSGAPGAVPGPADPYSVPGTHIWTPPYDPSGRHGAPGLYPPVPYAAHDPRVPQAYGPPAGYGYGPPPHGWTPPPPRPTNGMAIASLVCAIAGIPTGLAVVLGPVAVVLGVIGLGRAEREGNRGVAIAGLVIGGLECLALIALVVLLFGLAGVSLGP